jgi:hypothetical protein
MDRRSEKQVYRRLRGFFFRQAFHMGKLSHYFFLYSLFPKTDTNAKGLLWRQYITPTNLELGKQGP